MIKLNLNWRFMTAKPYGVILTGRMISSVILTISTILLGYKFRDAECMKFINAFFGLWSIISFAAHSFNFQKNLSTKSNSYFYIPFAFIDFIFGLFGIIFYTIELIIIVVLVINSYYFYFIHIVLFISSFITCIISGGLFGYYSLLLHVQTQNIKDLPIKEMVVEGDKITYFIPTEGNPEKTLI